MTPIGFPATVNFRTRRDSSWAPKTGIRIRGHRMDERRYRSHAIYVQLLYSGHSNTKVRNTYLAISSRTRLFLKFRWHSPKALNRCRIRPAAPLLGCSRWYLPQLQLSDTDPTQSLQNTCMWAIYLLHICYLWYRCRRVYVKSTRVQWLLGSQIHVLVMRDDTLLNQKDTGIEDMNRIDLIQLRAKPSLTVRYSSCD